MAKPPFSRSIEFKLAIRAFDERVIRKARIIYTYTPPWPYYHAQSRRERDGQLQLDATGVELGDAQGSLNLLQEASA